MKWDRFTNFKICQLGRKIELVKETVTENKLIFSAWEREKRSVILQITVGAA